MSATDITARVTVRTGYVYPSDLEVSWETTDAGHVYTWVGVKYDAEIQMRETSIYLATTFDQGMELARVAVAKHARTPITHRVAVAQVNVTEQGGMSFLATALEPADVLKF